jgi:hypothetical protein
MRGTRFMFLFAFLVATMLFYSIGLAADSVTGRIDSVTPGSGPPDDIITLHGAFGPHRVEGGGYKSVMLYKNGERKGTLLVQSWSENTVKLKVPYGIPAAHYDMMIVYNQFTSNSVGFIVRRPPHPNLSLDGVAIGFAKKKVECGNYVLLKPEDVRWLPDGQIDFDVIYGYKENNGITATGFENAMFWISNEDYSKSRKPKKVYSVENLALEGFGSRTVQTHVTIPRPEIGTLFVDVNLDQKQPESGNQFRRCSISVRFADFGRPDLTITKLKMVTKDPKVGESIKFEISVKNNGNQPSPPTVAGFTVGGSTRVHEVPIPSIEPGKSASENFIIAPLGKAQNYRLNAKIDYADRVKETLENNNESHTDFKVRQ